MLLLYKKALVPPGADAVRTDNEGAFIKTTKEDISRATTKNTLP